MDIKWGVRQRLQFLERELFWTGKISRQSLMESMGISKAQASIDIASYKRLAGENLIYDLSNKTYRVSQNFAPVFVSTSPHSFLDQQVGVCAEYSPLPFREIDPSHLRLIHKAVIDKSWVSIDYQSMTSSGLSSRTIAPHSFVFDGARWHVRAYDFISKEFRDFVLGRIKEAVETKLEGPNEELNWEARHDIAWEDEVELVLIPHPGLKPEQRDAICSDYRMSEGQAVLTVRKACLFYIVSRLRLLDEADDPAIQQIVMANKEEVKILLKSPQSMGETHG
ncbi:MAG: WYL domain-containing protein [Desulfuromonadales bacterium]|nr:WYL domain-containing protein [Desulfuromonadales bacterium]